ncbi:hypothetical protein SLS62_011021 [Diatrype stigma]|uniref:D-xylose 1-dehydrogenase (NADP(+), D-xylono-1,5-lactone-forming) n=1 Tax=Diatrype stigma TaxID=117547 RepID=A0AAN9U6H3_9PEZI
MPVGHPTGMISSWFVSDLVMPRDDAKANHIIQAVAGSTIEKSREFVATYLKGAPSASAQPAVYGSYDGVYNDPNVDCVYIGSPHAFHKRHCLAAIAAGKNVLCEKSFALSAQEAREVFAAAEAKGVYVAEAIWLRHRPLVADLRRILYEDKAIGDVFRTTADFKMYMDIANAPPTSRYKDLSLGAGSLLDIGVYVLNWALLTLDPGVPDHPETPVVKAVQSFDASGTIEVTTSAVLRFASSGRQGVITCSTEQRQRGKSSVIVTVDGTDGFVEVEGSVPSHPQSFTVYPAWTGDEKPAGRKYDYARPQQGFIYEADNTALDLAAGRKQSPIMPWAETVRVLEIMDDIRQQGGSTYPHEKKA